MNESKKIIPVFYAVDDNYAPFLGVSLKSIIANISSEYKLVIYVLNTEISESNKERISSIVNGSDSVVSIEYVDVADRMDKINNKIHLRDYYTKAIYYRIFIPAMFSQYEKVLYIDCDTVFVGDIAELYNFDLGDKILGAVHEEAMSSFDCFGAYSEDFLDVPKMDYFNSGLLLINTKKYNQESIETKFIDLMLEHKFEVAPDQDYLNVLLKGKVKHFDVGWNKTPIPNKEFPEEKVKVLHYKLNFKPWHYSGIRYEEYFWEYAKQTPYYNDLIKVRDEYTEEQKANDDLAFVNLQKMAWKYIESDKNFKNFKHKEIENRNLTRREVLERIAEFESKQKWDNEVENNPKTIILMPDKVDYLNKKLSSRIATHIANIVATNFYEKQIKKGDFIIEAINGLENYESVKGGAFITCNHFSPYDNYAVWRAIKPTFKRGKRLYKIIREGNFTNFKGLYGFFFRHCNTLPLSSNTETMKKFLKAIDVLIKRGERILIYPEQAMWWNYKKPRPLKNGAFKMAAKTNSPIIPAFITLKDSDKLDGEGFNIPKHTVWFLPPIYPKKEYSVKENAEYLKNENFRLWKELYEKVYETPLEYSKE